MNKDQFFKWLKRMPGFLLVFAIMVGCGGADCSENNLDDSGRVSIKAINISGGAAEHLDFFANGTKIADNIGWHASGPWASATAGGVTMTSRLHTSGTTAATRMFDMFSGRRYWVMAYDGLPTLRLMMTEVHMPSAAKATLVVMNGDHLRGSLDIHVTSGPPPTAGSIKLKMLGPGDSYPTSMSGMDLASGTYIVYGVKEGTLDVVWSLTVTLAAGGVYLAAPVSEGAVPYDPDLIKIE